MAVRVCRQVKKRAVRFFDSLATFSSHFSFFFFPLSLRWSFFLASRIKLCNWEKFNSRRFSIWVKECFSELFLDIVLYCVQTSISCVSKCKLVCVVCASCLNAAHWSRWHVYSCAYSSLSFSFVLVEETLGRRLFDYSSKEKKKKKQYKWTLQFIEIEWTVCVDEDVEDEDEGDSRAQWNTDNAATTWPTEQHLAIRKINLDLQIRCRQYNLDEFIQFEGLRSISRKIELFYPSTLKITI